jgi:SpoVK/Ycf46/Vps4 family AAA+-type ATPase
MQIDDLPSHVVVITATNHPELLDRAVWRRFQLRLVLPKPSLEQVIQWLERFEESLGESLCVSHTKVAQRLGKVKIAEREELATDISRR